MNPVPKINPNHKNLCRCGCGTEIEQGKKWVSGHNLKRRDENAIVKNGKTYKVIKCSECNESFERRTDQINRHGLKNFCSKKCMGISQARDRKGKPIPNARTGIYKNCEKCGKEFYVRLSREKKVGAKFCSKSCLHEFRKETGFVPKNFIGSPDNSGEKNGRYKHGKRVGGHVSKKKVREQVIARDGGEWCFLCGKPGPGLHLHRIVYGSQGGKYEVDNCVQLCPVHHNEVHSSKKKWMPTLLKYIEKMKVYDYE